MCSFILDYIDKLYDQLDQYVTSNTVPTLQDKKVPTLASKGPSYESIEQLEQETARKRRGAVTKPHYLTESEMELATKRTERAKRAKKSSK